MRRRIPKTSLGRGRLVRSQFVCFIGRTQDSYECAANLFRRAWNVPVQNNGAAEYTHIRGYR